VQWHCFFNRKVRIVRYYSLDILCEFVTIIYYKIKAVISVKTFFFSFFSFCSWKGIVKQFHSFYTDNRLCINSWGEVISKLKGRPSSEVLGKKYYAVLPRIVIDNRDIVI